MGKNYYLKDQDILDQALEHSWGKSAEAKAKEKAYNREYYQRHKEEILRKARQAGEGIQRTAQNAYDYGRKLANDARTSQNMRGHVQKERFVDAAGRMGSKILRKNADYFKTHGDNEYYDKAMRTARDYSRLRSNTAQAINEADKLARQNSPVERVKRDLRRTTAGARADVENAVNNARDYIDTATGKKGRRRGQNIDVRNYDKINSMNTRLSNEARERYNTASNDAVETARTARNYHQGRGHNPTYNKAYDEYLGRTANDVIDASNRAYKNQRRMANRSAASGAALNEATKAHDSAYRGYDSRYDNKLARDLQNTKAKARGAMSKAEKAAQQAREDAKKRMKKWFNR